MKRIRFYKPTDPFGEFSNFSNHPVVIDEKEWPTTEHYFQAKKFSESKYEEEIRKLKTPMEAKISGSDRKKPLRRDWEEVKNDVMYTALSAKFNQHQELMQLLISTGDSYLVEHTRNDRYWGDGGDGKGRNMLGRLLMKLRDELSKNIN